MYYVKHSTIKKILTMRLNKFTLAILFSVCSIYGFSQEQHPVKGKIENAKNEAVGMAAIQINKADSK